MPTDAIAMLKKQHREVSAVFKKLEKTTRKGKKTREKLFGDVKAMLDMHTTIEEKHLYPPLKEKKLTHDLTLEAYVEHDVAKDLLMQLEAEDKGTDEWLAKCIVAMEVVGHHVKEEEKYFFPKIRKIMSKKELLFIGAEMEQTKKEMGM